MASNTLLAGELARRNKEVEINNESLDSIQNNLQPQNNGAIGSDWKMVSPQPNNFLQSVVDQKPVNSGNYRNSSFSMAIQDLIGIEAMNSTSQSLVDSSTKIGTHFSNPSSLVTSLSSSREHSPDKTGPATHFGRPPLASKLVNPTAGASSWSPAISMAHFPVFAAWNDA